ncbi:hypothetical protein [Brevibacterium renqingii]|uniref:hypothetical protein n=1 Tax=Brevibacterium renqingii TaxID=2776916 RepID=UPI001ADF3C0C|nr:hypothetical protein [Brevibacterium renqingii]
MTDVSAPTSVGDNRESTDQEASPPIDDFLPRSGSGPLSGQTVVDSDRVRAWLRLNSTRP